MPSSSSQRDQYLVASQIVQDVSALEVLNRGKGWDSQLRRIAPPSLGRDEAVLAYISCVESAVHQGRLGCLDLDAAVCPAIDHIVAPLCAVTRSDQPSPNAVQIASSWVKPCLDYEPLAVAVINVLQHRMNASMLTSGRLAFWPSSSLQAQLRNRWFEERWRSEKSLAGAAVVPTEAELQAFVSSADAWAVSHMQHSDNFTPPDEPWLTTYADTLADRILSAQFSHVATTEIWGPLSVNKVEAALRPLYRRASRRFFLHSRVFAALKAYGHESPILPSAIEVIELSRLCDEVQEEAQLDATAANEFVQSLIRSRGEEKYRLSAYPLIPLACTRIAFLPSSVLYANWPLAREQAVGRARDSSIGKQRDRRHSKQLLAGFQSAGMTMVATSVLVRDLKQRDLTDLDVVAVAADRASVLVAQVKSFVTPTNLLDLDKSDKDAAEGIAQCQVASDNRDRVRAAIEERFKVTLPDNWEIYQVVIVEAIAGNAMADPMYPAVSMEWMLNYGLPNCSSSPRVLWTLARDLPDGETFMDSLSPFFGLHEVSFDGSRPEQLAILALAECDGQQP
jgi:hypothetical protein